MGLVVEYLFVCIHIYLHSIFKCCLLLWILIMKLRKMKNIIFNFGNRVFALRSEPFPLCGFPWVFLFLLYFYCVFFYFNFNFAFNCAAYAFPELARLTLPSAKRRVELPEEKLKLMLNSSLALFSSLFLFLFLFYRDLDWVAVLSQCSCNLSLFLFCWHFFLSFGLSLASSQGGQSGKGQEDRGKGGASCLGFCFGLFFLLLGFFVGSSNGASLRFVSFRLASFWLCSYLPTPPYNQFTAIIYHLFSYVFSCYLLMFFTSAIEVTFYLKINK